MSDTLIAEWVAQPTPKNDAELQAAVAQMFSALDQINRRIEHHQEESDRIGAETRIMLDALNKNNRQGA